jgi:hypothetical protein
MWANMTICTVGIANLESKWIDLVFSGVTYKFLLCY